MPNKWEIWTAKVKFEDDPTVVKVRPVLVISNECVYYLSLKITSHPPRQNYAGEYQIVKWQSAGLTRESTVRTTKKLKLTESDFGSRIGRLHPFDIIAIQKILTKQ